ncbi:glycoside hydrolase family 3 N-terminal domain-containing protein [Ornithinicoccus halotolerans]|uniref:glycoside hydrolase family 3 N-terminal domain-containing protein n=1 Tax=Ornithinicoccus halotolerans TaxID=1748220 RepID=UPI0012974B7C|nr:glycoside hydrolase family 3 N-terminal domain-containing protein [Ornithinicoccus halotolerans]
MSRQRRRRRASARGPVAVTTALLLLLGACSPDPGGSAGEGTGEETEQPAATAGADPSAGGPEPTGSTTAAGDDGTATAGEGGDEGERTGQPEPAVRPGLPSAQQLSRARQDVRDLDTQRLAGQVVVAAYPGTDPAAAAALVRQHHLAGVITLGGNVPEDPDARVDALTGLTGAVQQAVTDDGRDWPAFLGIDQEGGAITRVGAPLDRWPTAMALGAADRPELAGQAAEASGEQLAALGYTVVFAPVADVTTGPEDPTIGSRSPGSDPALVARTATAQAGGYGLAGVVPVLKHFPGHGSVPADSHLGTAVQQADLATLRDRDLVPFAEGVAAGVPAVMTGHIVLPAVDDQPATVSRAVTTGLLRQQLGFTGLVVTDALDMTGVSADLAPGEAAVRALLAGADVLLMPPDPAAAVRAIETAVSEGRLPRERLEEAAARTVATLRSHHRDRPDTDVLGSAGDLARRVAAGPSTTACPTSPRAPAW